MKKIASLSILFAFLMMSCKSSLRPDLGDGLFANIKTNKGEIIVRLEQEKTPITVANFVSLAEGTNKFVSEEFKNKKFYNGLTFHRVMKNFMIQGGDYLGNGTGNPGYRFKDEFNETLSHSKAGILSMANGGPKTNGSQFFITHAETPWLDGIHTVFGEVIEGMTVVDSIANAAVANTNPIEPIVMETVTIIRNGKVAKNFNASKIMARYFKEEVAIELANKKKKESFLKDILNQKNKATITPSGLGIFKLKEGNGIKPQMGGKVNVYYAGFLEDGTIIDSNIESVARENNSFDASRKEGGGYGPFLMDYTEDAPLIPGFREGLLNMNFGDKIRVFIPSHLGYGSAGRGGVIPPNANLFFELEIVE
ncbi:MAG: peptidyl-prolyl cis-trans isomerase A (cyclophilin A) [Flavobacteriaceae bacterium]|jgi:peptidyl-prolyl cis-trans isomerase A (cyclophilin A)